MRRRVARSCGRGGLRVQARDLGQRTRTGVRSADRRARRHGRLRLDAIDRRGGRAERPSDPRPKTEGAAAGHPRGQRASKGALMKTSLGIWAFGGMATRFNPGGYKPELAQASTAAKVGTAGAGRGELMDDYEFHYPQELNGENLEEVQQALDGHGIYCVCSGLHLDPRFAKGGFSSPDDATRAAALQLTKEGIDLAGELGAHFIIWPGIEGYNYPFQTAYTESWARFVDGVGESAQHAAAKGVTVFLEHKNSEPAMKIFMRNIGMSLHVIHKLRTRGIDNIQVNMDWQHLIMNGENLAEYAALLAAEGLVGPQPANSGWGPSGGPQ